MYAIFLLLQSLKLILISLGCIFRASPLSLGFEMVLGVALSKVGNHWGERISGIQKFL